MNRLRLLLIASACGLVAVCLPVLFSVRAEILPVKTYTAADGLPRAAVYSNGLLSVKRRAQELGGMLEVTSGNGDGTVIQLEAPLGGRKIL